MNLKPAQSPLRPDVAEALTVAIGDIAATFTPEAIDGVPDMAKRAQMLAALARARKLLAEKPARAAKPATQPPPLPPIDVDMPVSEAEWEAKHPAKLPSTPLKS